MQTSKIYSFKNFLFLLFIISSYRFLVLYSHLDFIDLYGDEAYYWGWSRSFEFGYYSKPPFMAWIISLFTSILGNDVLSIKLPSLVFAPLTAIFIYISTSELFDKKVAFFSGAVFFTLPAVSISSFIISTDVFLLFFWAMALMFFIKALKSDKFIYWLGAGMSGGLGLLSKYTMILFIISLLIYLALSKENHKILKNKNLYITMFIAVIIYLPNLIWNYNNEFVSFMHTKDISHIDKELFHFNKLIEFLTTQLGMIGVLFFPILLFLIFKPKLSDDKFKFLYILTIVFLGIISLQAFLAKAFANWAFPAYIAGVILVCYYLINHNKMKLLWSAIVVNLLLTITIYHYHSLANLVGFELNSKNDPYKRVMGWKKSADNISEVLKDFQGVKLLFDERKSMASFIYYLSPHPFNSVIWNPKNLYKNHYDLTTTLSDKKGENFIYITKDKKTITKIQNRFRNSKKLKTSKVKLYKDFTRTYYIYYLEDFKGYK